MGIRVPQTAFAGVGSVCSRPDFSCPEAAAERAANHFPTMTTSNAQTAGTTVSRTWAFASIQAKMAWSPTSISPATQPSSEAPRRG